MKLSDEKQLLLMMNTNLYNILTTSKQEYKIIDWYFRRNLNRNRKKMDDNVVFVIDPEIDTEYGRVTLYAREYNNKIINLYVRTDKGIAFLYKENIKRRAAFTMAYKYLKINVKKHEERLKSLKTKKQHLPVLYKKIDYTLSQFKPHHIKGMRAMLKYIGDNFEPTEEFYFKCVCLFLGYVDLTLSTARSKYKKYTEWLYDGPPILNHVSLYNLESIPISYKYKSNRLSYEEFLVEMSEFTDADIVDFLVILGSDPNSKRPLANPRYSLYTLIHRKQNV